MKKREHVMTAVDSNSENYDTVHSTLFPVSTPPLALRYKYIHGFVTYIMIRVRLEEVQFTYNNV